MPRAPSFLVLVGLAVVLCSCAAADLQLTAAARKAYADAKALARKEKHGTVAPVHLASTLFRKDGVGSKLAARAGADVDHIRVCVCLLWGLYRLVHFTCSLLILLYRQRALNRVLHKEAVLAAAPDDPPHAPALNRALQHAEALRRAAGDTHIAADQLLLALAAEGDRPLRDAMMADGARAACSPGPVKSEQAEGSWDAL